MRMVQIIGIKHGVVDYSHTFIIKGEDTDAVSKVESKFLSLGEYSLGRKFRQDEKDVYLDEGCIELSTGSICLHWPNVSFDITVTNHE